MTKIFELRPLPAYVHAERFPDTHNEFELRAAAEKLGLFNRGDGIKSNGEWVRLPTYGIPGFPEEIIHLGDWIIFENGTGDTPKAPRP